METMNNGAEVTGEYFHQMVHEGRLVEFYYENLALPAGPTYFLIKTGLLPIHITIRLEGTGRIKVDTFNKPTTTADGTPIVGGNFNAVSPKPMGTTVFLAPTVTAEGAAKISKTIFGANQGNSTLASSFTPGAERIWGPNDTYLLKVTTVDTSPWFRLSIDCYEENI